MSTHDGTANRRRGRGVAVAGLAAAVLVAGGVAATASIPSSDGSIDGCYASNGDLRVIDTATDACKKNETAISWNQTGAPGPVGPMGPQGPQGEPATSRFAVVAADGTVTNSSGVITSAPLTERTDTGIYQVAFTDPIIDCAMAITVRQTTLGEVTPMFAKGGHSSPTQVNLVIFKLDGTSADQAFDLTVTC